MSVDTLVGKEARGADSLQEKNLAIKAAVTEVSLRKVPQKAESDQTKNTEKDSIAEIVQPENTPTAVSFDNNQIRDTLEKINKVIPIANTRLVFEFDELGDPPIIKVIDKTNNEVIREIPSQDLVKVAKAFSEMADNLSKAGALINFQA